MKFLLIIPLLLLMLSCKEEKAHPTVDYVDLDRFMGDWYVISIMPNMFEKKAVNSIETYEMTDKGDIEITYTFFKGSREGKKKVMHPKASVYNKETNAEWRVQFFWPVKFPYLVIWLDEDYETTVIGVPNRKYAWIMSRSPEIDKEHYREILSYMKATGYDVDKLMEIPQEWD